MKEKAVRTLSIINLGQYLFDYKWELQYQSPFADTVNEVASGYGDSDIISLTPLQGGVDKGEKKTCLLTFAPPQPMVLRNCELTLKVAARLVACHVCCHIVHNADTLGLCYYLYLRLFRLISFFFLVGC